MTIACSVVAKSHVLYSGDLYSIVLPGVEGYLGIQENHEPFMTYLVDGIMWGRVRDSQGPIIGAVNMGGYVQVIGRRVVVLCDKTRFLDDIDFDLLKRDIPRFEEKLRNTSEDDFAMRSYLRRKLHWLYVQFEGKKKEIRYKQMSSFNND